MKEVLIILPNQLHENNEALQKNIPIYLVEEYMFFNQYNFHKQKLVFQRASMKNYENYLNENSYDVEYINSNNKLSDIRDLIQFLSSSISKINVIDPVDFLLDKRIKSSCEKNNLDLQVYENPSFINKRNELKTFFKNDKVKFYHSSFYKNQRKKYNILIDKTEPEGGKWSYDDENRKKYPKDKLPPKINYKEHDKTYKESIKYIMDPKSRVDYVYIGKRGKLVIDDENLKNLFIEKYNEGYAPKHILKLIDPQNKLNVTQPQYGQAVAEELIKSNNLIPRTGISQAQKEYFDQKLYSLNLCVALHLNQ